MEGSSRRPLKSRSTAWARSLASTLASAGVAPNAISAFSVIAAALGGGAFLAASHGRMNWSAGWTAGALMIQLRLLCNLMDGMVAIEGGRKSPTGDLWNEIPDRLADGILFVCSGFAIGLPWAGAISAWAAVMTAYVRVSGAALTGHHDFIGPFAKPQRMAVLTAAALVTAADPLWAGGGGVMKAAVAIIAAGTCLTIVRRTLRLAVELKSTPP